MLGVRLNFYGAAPVFDFATPVVNFDATVQNAMVNLGTDLGSDPIFKDRGTYLLQDAVKGRMVNLQWANHTANFAAMRTTAFCKAYDTANNLYGLQSLNLSASTFNTYRLRFDLTATCVDGTVVGGSNYSL
jgi:hypothetical protein